MSQTQIVANPFELMLDPEAVFRAMECSERLAHLQRRVYRPLDKPQIGKRDSGEGGGTHADDPQED
jgi:hypothetical protein